MSGFQLRTLMRPLKHSLTELHYLPGSGIVAVAAPNFSAPQTLDQHRKTTGFFSHFFVTE